MPSPRILMAAFLALSMLAQTAATPGPPKEVTEARDKAKAALEAKNIPAAKEHCRLGLDLFGRLPAATRVDHAAFRVQFDMLAAEVDKADALIEDNTRQAADLLKAGKPALAQRVLAEIAEYAADPRCRKIQAEIDRKLPPPTGGEPDPRMYAVYEYWSKAEAEYKAKNIQVAKETCQAGLKRFEKLPRELKREHARLGARFELLQADLDRDERLLEERTKAVRVLIDTRALARAQAALLGIEEYRQDPRYSAVKQLLDEKLAGDKPPTPLKPDGQKERVALETIVVDLEQSLPEIRLVRRELSESRVSVVEIRDIFHRMPPVNPAVAVPEAEAVAREQAALRQKIDLMAQRAAGDERICESWVMSLQSEVTQGKSRLAQPAIEKEEVYRLSKFSSDFRRNLAALRSLVSRYRAEATELRVQVYRLRDAAFVLEARSESSNWIYGRWQRAPGDRPDAPQAMEITRDRWTVMSNGKSCEITITRLEANRGSVTLTGRFASGAQVMADLNPAATGSGFQLHLRTERLADCIYADANYVRAVQLPSSKTNKESRPKVDNTTPTLPVPKKK